jgi:hypothetical protein
MYIVHISIVVTLPEWLTGSPAIYSNSGWSLTASVRIAQVTLFLFLFFILILPPSSLTYLLSFFFDTSPNPMSANKYANLPDIVRIYLPFPFLLFINTLQRIPRKISMKRLMSSHRHIQTFVAFFTSSVWLIIRDA